MKRSEVIAKLKELLIEWESACAYDLDGPDLLNTDISLDQFHEGILALIWWWGDKEIITEAIRYLEEPKGGMR